MSWLRHWKIVLALTGLFLLGAATGTVVTLKVVKRFIESRTNPDRMSQTLFQEYDRRLHLTPEQIERIRPILQRTAREMWDVRAEGARRTFQVIRLSQEEIAAELTPAQREEFERVNEMLRERYRPPATPAGPPRKGPLNRTSEAPAPKRDAAPLNETK